MGLLDTLFGKAGATPVFNPNDPMQGFYDPTEEERKQARKMAALQAGAGMLMNNTGNYGAFSPALGAGIASGVQGYQQGLQIGPERRMKEMQQRLYGLQVQAQSQKAMQGIQDDKDAAEESKLFFASMGIDPENMQGSFMPVAGARPVADERLDLSAMPQGMAAKQKTATGLDIQSAEPLYSQQEFGAAVPMQPPQIESVLDDLGYTPGMKKMFYAHAKNNPKAAEAKIQKEVTDFLKAQRSGRREARDVIAKERAIAEAMGVPLQEYLTNKANKSGVNLTIENYAGDASKKMAQKEGYDIGEQAAMIENKWSAVDSVREAKDILAKGIYGGYWGDVGQKVAKASMGALGDRQKAARTEEFMAYIGNTVVPRLKEFGGNDSNEEMRYLQRIMGGDTSMEPEAIANILESAERKIMRGIERLQRQRGSLERGEMPSLDAGPSRTAPQKAPVQQKAYSFTAPNGKTYVFQSQEALDKFKKAAGVR